ncbi:cytochrome P450 2B4-like [Babylonia areolata]|uniref:cytochrome P450 2B4-like n=1 Tax=Babylonia areolata TaxID=304850 RepID=UPI003FD332F3
MTSSTTSLITMVEDILGLSVTLLLTAVVVGLSLLWLWLHLTNHPRPATTRLPPGPGFALPVLGHLHLLGKDPRAKLHQWRERYGDVFSVLLGSRQVVILCGFPAIWEAFVKHGDVFSHRMQTPITDRIFKGKGIILSHGPTWKEQRKASLEILRKLGMGKNLLASKVQEEVSHYIRAVEDHQGQPADLHRLTTVSMSNNICSIVFGRRFRYDDPVFIRYIENVEDNLERLGSTDVIHFIPFLEYLPGDLFGIRQIMANVKAIEETFFQPLIDEHVRPSTMTGGGDDDDSGNDKDELNGDSDGDDDEHQQGPARDFIYGYLQQMRRKEKQGVFTSLCEPELLTTVGDLFIAGTETTSVILRWTLLYFLHHQHVQDRCFQEVREVIGLHRPPTIRDRPRMVYLEATLNEVLRVSSIGPFAIGHSTACDVSFRGYVIPRGTAILPFLDTALHDPEVWGGDPYSFRPERFIDADGKLVRPEEFIPFGVGRRMCLGEALARVELFLYLSTLVQHFRFLPSEPEALPSLVGHLSVMHVPEPYKIRAVRRRE